MVEVYAQDVCLARALEINKPTWRVSPYQFQASIRLHDASILGRRHCRRASSLFKRRRYIPAIRTALGASFNPRDRDALTRIAHS